MTMPSMPDFFGGKIPSIINPIACLFWLVREHFWLMQCLYIPFAELVDVEKELERYEQEKAKLQGEVDRVNKKLSNEGFVAKAPAKLLDEEKAKKEKYETMLEAVIERIAHLSK